ncbi:uncharacterized protein LOC116070692 [Mastomys coucha]|uniref:uncharacterized protein LOC116070692 n=1 Tax=Mastomys coucha TaxID=35658 RepID=UPI001261AF7D|nr:uncharacterized protein LOC116070692 [Mastomys coucha]
MVAGGRESRVPHPHPAFLGAFLTAEEFSRPGPNDLSSPCLKASRWPESLTTSCSRLRNPATSTPPQDGRSTRAEQSGEERSGSPPRGVGGKFARSNQSSRPWDRPVAGTRTALQPLQLREGNLGSRHLLWSQRETLVDLFHSPSCPGCSRRGGAQPPRWVGTRRNSPLPSSSGPGVGTLQPLAARLGSLHLIHELFKVQPQGTTGVIG